MSSLESETLVVLDWPDDDEDVIEVELPPEELPDDTLLEWNGLGWVPMGGGA